MGVIRGLAGVKLSGSLNMYGYVRVNNINDIIIIINPERSLKEKNGWKGILSMFLLIPKGLLEPVWCRSRRWIIERAAIMNGKRK